MAETVTLTRSEYDELLERIEDLEASLALARALLRGAPILLMDEPTASLDPQAAAEVSDALQAEAARGVTVIIASHAVSRFAWVDRSVTLSEGRLTEAPHA